MKLEYSIIYKITGSKSGDNTHDLIGYWTKQGASRFCRF